MDRCPVCNTVVSQHEALCMKTGDVLIRVHCPGCRLSWESMDEFWQSCQRYGLVRDLPTQICRVCGHDAPPDELWAGLHGDAGVCRHCRQCPGCGGVLLRRDPTQVVCSICGSNWKDGLEFAADFLPRVHIYHYPGVTEWDTEVDP